MADLAPKPPVRMRVDLNVIVNNWKRLHHISGNAGAAIKANAYGLGAKQVAKKLYDAGCRDFFVANWNEADALRDIIPMHHIAVLNGVSGDDIGYAAHHDFIPVLNTPNQIQLWKNHAAGKPCHIMIDSGINRLGLKLAQIDANLLGDVNIDILMSHLASADEDGDCNEMQRISFETISQSIRCKRKSLANSAGTMLGRAYHYDLVRPGLAIYGGVARRELANEINPVVSLYARVLQSNIIKKGSPIGYNGLYICPKDMPVVTCAIGYADGYLRSFSNHGSAQFGNAHLPVIGRVSMDLVTLDASNCLNIMEGDWITIDYNLSKATQASGLSQYELLTILGDRFEREYIE